ncbi:hypothetical protein SAMN06265346_12010 [Flavobacterium hercynium]|nr:hypothetical protein SAMN06265346_12010 [Flavobacterium hercynium]
MLIALVILQTKNAPHFHEKHFYILIQNISYFTSFKRAITSVALDNCANFKAV